MAASWWWITKRLAELFLERSLPWTPLALLMSSDTIPSKQAAVVYMQSTGLPNFIYLLPLASWILQSRWKHQEPFTACLQLVPHHRMSARGCGHPTAGTVFWHYLRAKHAGGCSRSKTQAFEMELGGPIEKNFGLRHVPNLEELGLKVGSFVFICSNPPFSAPLKKWRSSLRASFAHVGRLSTMF